MLIKVGRPADFNEIWHWILNLRAIRKPVKGQGRQALMAKLIARRSNFLPVPVVPYSHTTAHRMYA